MFRRFRHFAISPFRHFRHFHHFRQDLCFSGTALATRPKRRTDTRRNEIVRTKRRTVRRKMKLYVQNDAQLDDDEIARAKRRTVRRQ